MYYDSYLRRYRLHVLKKIKYVLQRFGVNIGITNSDVPRRKDKKSKDCFLAREDPRFGSFYHDP